MTTYQHGTYTSIALDSNDAVHISYYRIADGLKYATCSNNCTNASNWDIVSINSGSHRIGTTSIAIDSNDGVHISFYDENNDDLDYATCSSGCTSASNWDIVSVDTTGTVGPYNSIAIDSNDGIHISYKDYTNDDLKYATCSSDCTNASNWDTVSLDTSTTNVGKYTSIAIDSDDVIHISYHHEGWGDLKYATCSSGCTNASNWDILIVDAPGKVGRSIHFNRCRF